MTLETFMIESNAIERIDDRSRLPREIEAMKEFLESPLSTESVVALVKVFQPKTASRKKNGLRVKKGMNVTVGGQLIPVPRDDGIVMVPFGGYRAPDGGPAIAEELAKLLDQAAHNELNPFLVHQAYEKLHPFLDGNGRSGRAVWLWQMRESYRYDYQIGFLHWFYYQSLKHFRADTQ